MVSGFRCWEFKGSTVQGVRVGRDWGESFVGCIAWNCRSSAQREGYLRCVVRLLCYLKTSTCSPWTQSSLDPEHWVLDPFMEQVFIRGLMKNVSLLYTTQMCALGVSPLPQKLAPKRSMAESLKQSVQNFKATQQRSRRTTSTEALQTCNTILCSCFEPTTNP